MVDGRIAVRPGEDLQPSIYQALELCDIWKARSSGPLPHAIECSYSLAQLLVTDSTDAASSNILQLSYATVIIRSVNGLADRLQQKRRFTAPISKLCYHLGLPGWIVDVRHEAAHNRMPSMEQLRLAAHSLLGFFCQRYWGQSSRQELREHAQKLLEAYVDPSTMPPAAAAVTVDEDENKDDDGTPVDNFDDEDGWLNNNFFAALFDAPAKKKSTEETEEEESKTKKPRRQNDKKPDTTSDDFGQRFVNKIPQDMAYQVALNFFIWGTAGDNNDTDDPTGVILSHSVDDVASQETYLPLLVLLCQTWPGFLGALVTHCVEYRLLNPWKEKVEHVKESDPLSDWVQHLLERNFLNQVIAGESLSSSKSTPKMVRLRLPLKSLTGRLDKEVPLRRVLQRFVTVDKAGRVEDTTKAPSNWSVVESWEASTIGSLPGCAV
jgi:hypothetical protein